MIALDEDLRLTAIDDSHHFLGARLAFLALYSSLWVCVDSCRIPRPDGTSS